MKTFLILLGMVVAGAIGYLMEPKLREQFTGIAPPEEKNPAPQTAPATPGIDPASLTAAQLPKTVALKIETKFSDPAAGIAMSIAAGSHVKLLRIQGTSAIVSAGKTEYPISIPISQTDLLEQLAVQPPPSPAAAAKPAPAAPAPATAAKPADPAPAAKPATPAPAPAPTPAPAAEPADKPAVPAPAAAPDVVKVMQESIRGGQIKEFTFKQVLGWKAGADETVDGVVFQTGTASYKAKTIFGEKTIQAKALVKDGKVRHWICPKSGMEIK